MASERETIWMGSTQNVSYTTVSNVGKRILGNILRNAKDRGAGLVPENTQVEYTPSSTNEGL